MEPIYSQEFYINDLCVDRFGYLKPSGILFFAQEVAGQHCNFLSVDHDTLMRRRMFWAVIRHRVQITRLPRRGETIRVETWPMPTTRVAYPRSVVAYDESGNECFRSISLWVLMDMDSRSMILPGKSGIEVLGTLRGTELAPPSALTPGKLLLHRRRFVNYTDLDRNGHMNNTRYFDWIYDLLPSSFHSSHRVKEFTVCYFSESREGDELTLRWDAPEADMMQVDIHREKDGKEERIFAAKIQYDM